MRRRLIATALTLTAWVAGTVAGSIGTASTASGAPILEIGRAHAGYTPALTGDDPIFILLLGSDARPGTPVDRGLSDSIHVLGINPGARRATLIGIPRDSYVPLSTGGTGKINGAMPRGGPSAAVATVERLTGLTFDYYMLAGFRGMTGAIDELDGLTIDIPYSFAGHEGTSFHAGKDHLTSAEVLEYGRTRKTVSHGDFDRSMNQGRVLVAALAQFRKEFAKDGVALFRWLGAGFRHVQTDLAVDEVLSLGFTATVVNPKRVTNLVLSGSVATADGASIVRLDSSYRRYFDDIAKDGYVLPGAIAAENQPMG